MKGLFYLTIISTITLFACNKSSSIVSSDIKTAGAWQLVQKNWFLGGGSGVLTPSKDSSVLLILNTNNTYISQLNGKTISAWSYSITKDTSYNNAQVLQLNNFKTTGIFSLFTVEELGTNNQILSVFNGLFMNISNDTLTLSSASTPGGWDSYIFVKE